jgi:hypothetical protein
MPRSEIMYNSYSRGCYMDIVELHRAFFYSVFSYLRRVPVLIYHTLHVWFVKAKGASTLHSNLVGKVLLACGPARIWRGALESARF